MTRRRLGRFVAACMIAGFAGGIAVGWAASLGDLPDIDDGEDTSCSPLC